MDKTTLTINIIHAGWLLALIGSVVIVYLEANAESGVAIYAGSFLFIVSVMMLAVTSRVKRHFKKRKANG